MLFAEVAAARLLPGESVETHDLGQLEEVVDPSRLLQALVQSLCFAQDADVVPELLVEGRDLGERLFQSGRGARHPAVIEHDLAELPVEPVDGAGAANGHEAVNGGGDLGLRFGERRVVGRHRRLVEEFGQVVGDGGREDEVAVGQALHQRRRPEAVGPVVGEVRFAEGVQARDGSHQVVVHPEAAHRVVGRRVDPHRDLVRVLVGDSLVHLEEVVVPLCDDALPEAADRVGEVEVDAVLERSHTSAGVHFALGRPGSHIPRHQVAEGRVATLQEIVAVGHRDVVGGALVSRGLRHPDAAVVSQRLGHQGELGLELVRGRDAGRVDLGEARVGECGSLAVGPPDGGHVGSLGICGQEEDVGVAAGGEHDGVSGVPPDGAGDEVPGHDADRPAILDHEVEHLAADVELDRSPFDLAHQGLIGAEQQLLAGLPPGVEGARDLGAAERPIVEQTAVLPGEGDALGCRLVDDVQ